MLGLSPQAWQLITVTMCWGCHLVLGSLGLSCAGTVTASLAAYNCHHVLGLSPCAGQLRAVPCTGAVTMRWGRHLELGSLELSCTGRAVIWCWSAFYLSPVLTSSSSFCTLFCPHCLLFVHCPVLIVSYLSTVLS